MNRFNILERDVKRDLFELSIKYAGHELYLKTTELIIRFVKQQVELSNWDRQRFEVDMINFVNNGDLIGDKHSRCLARIRTESVAIDEVATDFGIELC